MSERNGNSSFAWISSESATRAPFPCKQHHSRWRKSTRGRAAAASAAREGKKKHSLARSRPMQSSGTKKTHPSEAACPLALGAETVLMTTVFSCFRVLRDEIKNGERAGGTKQQTKGTPRQINANQTHLGSSLPLLPKQTASCLLPRACCALLLALLLRGGLRRGLRRDRRHRLGAARPRWAWKTGVFLSVMFFLV